MNKIFKSILKITMFLMIVFFTISVLVALLVDINHYKKEIVQIVEQETGLKLEINGDMKLTIFSGFKFNVNDVKLSLGEELIADIDSLYLGLKLYSIYQGEPVISSIKLRVKTLRFSRDKKGQFNFLPLYNATASNKTISNKTISNKTEHKKNVQDTDNLSLNYLAIKNISLSIEKFQYLDDLESVSVKLNQVQASLSLLPIIDHYELVIDDPRVLVNYNYSGELNIKQAFINQYQIANLSLLFKDKKGDFIAQKLAFNFVQEGTEHASPPLVFDATGKLSFKLFYQTPEGASEPLWTRPDIIKVGSFDFNLPKLRFSEKSYQFETEKAHIVFEEVAIFEAGKYKLDNFFIKTLALNGKKINIKLQDEDQYHLKNYVLQMTELPVIHKGKILDIKSDLFLQKFAQKGSIKFSSDSLRQKAEGINAINLSLTGKDNKISLSKLSFLAMESAFNAEGHLLLNKTALKSLSNWQFNVRSEKLNLKPLADLLNLPSHAEGYISFDTHLSGDYQNSTFNLNSGLINTKANNILLRGIDIDKVLESFQSSQSVGLLDVGAIALLGPAGMLVTKGNDYNNLVKSLESKGNSKIKQLNSEISFSDSIATFKDVAFATEKYRLAAKGQIDVAKKIFINFEVATIDKPGCVIYKEQVTGSLESPAVKKVNILVKGVVNPIGSLVSKVTKPLNMNCKEPFYTGVVAAPAK